MIIWNQQNGRCFFEGNGFMKKKRSSRFSASVLLPMVIALCLGLTACGASAAGGTNEAEAVMETATAAGDTKGETVTEGGDSLTSPASLSSPQTALRVRLLSPLRRRPDES